MTTEKNYHTNVIVRKDTPYKQILQMAREQVAKQWKINNGEIPTLVEGR
ncbi:BA3454 family stress response protein [Neobacillus cucumis]